MSITWIVYGITSIGAAIGFLLLLPASVGSNRLVRMPICAEPKKIARQFAEMLRRVSVLREWREETMDREIYEALSFMRNMPNLKEREVGGEYVIGYLIGRSGLLKTAYSEFLSLMRINRQQEAEKAFLRICPTQAAAEFVSTLVNWDKLPPSRLREIIFSQQRSIREMCITRQNRREETISDLIYLPVVLNVFLIFLNFVIVAYFMEQKEILDMLI